MEENEALHSLSAEAAATVSAKGREAGKTAVLEQGTERAQAELAAAESEEHEAKRQLTTSSPGSSVCRMREAGVVGSAPTAKALGMYFRKPLLSVTAGL